MYLYIFEDGTISQSSISPLHEDYACIREGLLQVICLKDEVFKELDENGRLINIGYCVPDKTNCYHEPE